MDRNRINKLSFPYCSNSFVYNNNFHNNNNRNNLQTRKFPAPRKKATSMTYCKM